jgi:hypothetical protein
MAGNNYFDKATVLAGLYTAMDFGAPNTASDKATFYMPRTVESDGNTDSYQVSYNPDNHRELGPLVKKTVPCAVEYLDAAGKEVNLGTINPSRVRLTVLGPDYQNIKGFEYVAISGQKFLYTKTEPIIALGSIDVAIIYCTAEDLM